MSYRLHTYRVGEAGPHAAGVGCDLADAQRLGDLYLRLGDEGAAVSGVTVTDTATGEVWRRERGGEWTRDARPTAEVLA